MLGFAANLAASLGFIIVTAGLGGGAAAMSGRALALSWQPRWHLAVVAFLLALAARFLHYALLKEELLSAWGFAADFILLLAVAWAGFHVTRAQQMKRQYGWLDSLSAEKAEADAP